MGAGRSMNAIAKRPSTPGPIEVKYLGKQGNFIAISII
ncbi:hypothetical protein CES86_4440 [Brucella lupini]|uniref:Uncharacterized protein n=1 Tax=Brucella lupini TaxID=255457 RepID=A0A256GD42_9HYPH|nr:hypothetical protein CES86_4440 [Brucella lupini]